jgi:hypothetical protein
MTRVPNDGGFDDVEELRKRFEEFRNQHQRRTRLPEELWRTAAEIAERLGMTHTGLLERFRVRGLCEPPPRGYLSSWSS